MENKFIVLFCFSFFVVKMVGDELDNFKCFLEWVFKIVRDNL